MTQPSVDHYCLHIIDYAIKGIASIGCFDFATATACLVYLLVKRNRKNRVGQQLAME